VQRYADLTIRLTVPVASATSCAIGLADFVLDLVLAQFTDAAAAVEVTAIRDAPRPVLQGD